MPTAAPPDYGPEAAAQLAKVRALWKAILPANKFYTAKLAGVGTVNSLAEYFARVPFTTKLELAADQQAHPPFGTNLTYVVDRYTRYHQTSASTGAPLRWLDTEESWNSLLGCWDRVYDAAGVTPADRIFFAFSFGPFLGFWTAFESGTRRGSLCIPGGGMSSIARLQTILATDATVLCCTPTYALRLAEAARDEPAAGADPAHSKVRLILVAGEPGGSIPAVRQRIEAAWPGARVRDHHGMTEVGPVSYECPARPGVLHIMENAFLAEIVDPATGQAVPAGATGELVLTTLARTGSPLLRYRTGDLVRAEVRGACACGTHALALSGGILGRADDMVLVRGVNIYPTAVDEVLRGFAEVVEYRVRVGEQRSMLVVALEVEPAAGCAAPDQLARHIEERLKTVLSLRIPVTLAAPGSLPRFEMKARRWVRGAPA